MTVSDNMRQAADLLAAINRLYNYAPEAGSWSPNTLRYEADYLERHVAEEIS